MQRIIRLAATVGYSDAEIKTAMHNLVNWVRYGVKPEGDNVLGDLSDAGEKSRTLYDPGNSGTIRVP